MIRYVDSSGYKSNKVHPEVSRWHISPTGKFLFLAETCDHLFYFAFTAGAGSYEWERVTEDLTSSFFFFSFLFLGDGMSLPIRCFSPPYNSVYKYKVLYFLGRNSRPAYMMYRYVYISLCFDPRRGKLDRRPRNRLTILLRSRYLPVDSILVTRARLHFIDFVTELTFAEQ